VGKIFGGHVRASVLRRRGINQEAPKTKNGSKVFLDLSSPRMIPLWYQRRLPSSVARVFHWLFAAINILNV